MFKKLIWLCWLGVLAWFFSPVLEVVFLVPTDGMVEGIFNLSKPGDRNLLQILRFIVWMTLIHILIKFTGPFLSFALPTAKRYAVTKPVRRIQGVMTEMGLFGFAFVAVSVIVVMPFGINKTFQEEKDKRIEEVLNSVDELIKNREAARVELRDIAILGNEWLIQNRNRLNNLYRTSNPYEIKDDEYFTIPRVSYLYEPIKTTFDASNPSLGKYPESKPDDKPRYQTLSYKPTNASPEPTAIDRNKIGQTFRSNQIRKFMNKKSDVEKRSVLQSLKANRINGATYNIKVQKFNDAYNEYRKAADEVMAVVGLPSDEIQGRDYFFTIDKDDPKFIKKAKSDAWDSFWAQPFNLIVPALTRHWIWALVIGLFVYGISFSDNRHKLATRYEKVLRFFEQGRFGLGGSSRFAGIVEEWASLFKHQKEGIFLGRSLFNPRLILGIEDKRHMLTVAATRAGKGTTAIIPNLLLWKGSTIVIDPKGTNAIVTARKRREMGQDVHIVDPFNIVKPEETAHFNPLEKLDPNSPTIREDISIIAEALVVPDPEQKERHWDDGARTVIAGLIAHLVSSDEFENPDLSMIRDLLGMTPKEQEDLWLDMIMNEKAGGLAKDAGTRIMRGISTNEINSIISNADKHTEWLSAPTMKCALSTSTFDFREMKEKPTTVYLILPPNKLVTYNRFLRLFINLTLSEISSGGRSKIPMLMIMDEFLALGRMDEVEKAFGLLAGYNLIMWPIVQEIGKLKDIYKSSFNSFINNSRAVQVFGVYGETAKFISDILGERRTKSLITSDNRERVAKLRAPNEVTIDVSIDSNWQYVLRAGKAPLVLEKIPYYKHSMFEGIYDKDPDYI